MRRLVCLLLAVAPASLAAPGKVLAVLEFDTPIVSAESAPAPQLQQQPWSQQVTAPAPPPQSSSEPSHWGGGLAVNVGYYNWSIDAAGATASSSGLTYGLSGDLEYKFGNL